MTHWSFDIYSALFSLNPESRDLIHRKSFDSSSIIFFLPHSELAIGRDTSQYMHTPCPDKTVFYSCW